MKPQNYVVCSTVRSGSTLLCKTLEQLGSCGRPEEYFHRHTIRRLKLDNNPKAFFKYCQEIVQQGQLEQSDSLRSEPFGLKLHWWQLLDFLRLARQSPRFASHSDIEILNTIFPNLTFIYLHRGDIVAQAVSAAIATQTGQWERLSKNESDRPTAWNKPIKFQPWRIYEWDKALREHNASWQTFFRNNSITPHEIVYEDLISAFPPQMNRLLQTLKVDANVASADLNAPTQRQGNQINQQFISTYRRWPRPLLKALYRLYRLIKSQEVSS